MSIKRSHDQIKAQIWKSIAQSGIDLSILPESDLETLVELVTDAAMVEIDKQIDQEIYADRSIPTAEDLSEGMEEEKILWEGRPFLSISTKYIITNERVRIIQGLFGKNREDIEHILIQDIDQTQTLTDRLINVGDIVIRSHDRSDPTVKLNDVRNPEEIHEILRRAVIAARQKHNLIYREEM